MEWLTDFFAAYPWGVYALVAVGPFIQEDAAIISAAAAAAAGAGSTQGIFLTLIIALSISDLWKYWLGRAGHQFEWGRKFAQKPGVEAAGEKVKRRLGLSLVTARFVPGARIPVYLACGFLRAPFPKVAFFVILSAIAYCVIAFALFAWLGDMAGERIHMYAPIVAICIVFCIIGFLGLKAWRAHKAASSA